jgi:hypothetical protein
LRTSLKLIGSNANLCIDITAHAPLKRIFSPNDYEIFVFIFEKYVHCASISRGFKNYKKRRAEFIQVVSERGIFDSVSVMKRPVAVDSRWLLNWLAESKMDRPPPS